ncbi:MAG: ArgE/DapE family deacylase [Spirochaetales bacterium]|nr:ArgE/DapE family deacylase [Spirochaetales bacterium]
MNNVTAKEAVNRWIDERREEIIEYLRALIRIPSVNPWFTGEHETGEREVQELIAATLRPLGAEIDMWEPDAAHLSKWKGYAGYYEGRDFTDRPNLAATVKGSGGGRSILLTGHVDVVKAGSGWSYEPFAATRENGWIIGRGAADMKGGDAAMIMAVKAVVESGVTPRGDILVGTVADEEAGGMGTLAFVDRGYRADACVLTEPTDLNIAPLCRGILWGRLGIAGRSGHIEMPQGDWRTGGAVDAIDRARLYLDAFDRLNADWRVRKTHPLMPIPCQIFAAELHAGEYPTAFANRAEITFNAQYLPMEKDEFGLGGNVKRELLEYFEAVAQSDPWLVENAPTVEWLVDADCGETPSEDPFVEAAVAASREVHLSGRLEGITSHTDMGWFVNVGIPTINFGPGKPRVAHQSDEAITEDDLIAATRMIASLIVDWTA